MCVYHNASPVLSLDWAMQVPLLSKGGTRVVKSWCIGEQGPPNMEKQMLTRMPLVTGTDMSGF